MQACKCNIRAAHSPLPSHTPPHPAATSPCCNDSLPRQGSTTAWRGTCGRQHPLPGGPWRPCPSRLQLSLLAATRSSTSMGKPSATRWRRRRSRCDGVQQQKWQQLHAVKGVGDGRVVVCVCACALHVCWCYCCSSSLRLFPLFCLFTGAIVTLLTACALLLQAINWSFDPATDLATPTKDANVTWPASIKWVQLCVLCSPTHMTTPKPSTHSYFTTTQTHARTRTRTHTYTHAHTLPHSLHVFTCVLRAMGWQATRAYSCPPPLCEQAAAHERDCRREHCKHLCHQRPLRPDKR